MSAVGSQCAFVSGGPDYWDKKTKTTVLEPKKYAKKYSETAKRSPIGLSCCIHLGEGSSIAGSETRLSDTEAPRAGGAGGRQTDLASNAHRICDVNAMRCM